MPYYPTVLHLGAASGQPTTAPHGSSLVMATARFQQTSASPAMEGRSAQRNADMEPSGKPTPTGKRKGKACPLEIRQIHLDELCVSMSDKNCR